MRNIPWEKAKKIPPYDLIFFKFKYFILKLIKGSAFFRSLGTIVFLQIILTNSLYSLVDSSVTFNYSTQRDVRVDNNDLRFSSGAMSSNPVANTDVNFVGHGYDMSAVGWINKGSTVRLQNISLLSPLQYWGAAHYSPTAGSTVNFFNGTSLVQATTGGGYISEGSQTDIYVGGFTSAISNSSNLHINRILDISSGNYAGQAMLVMGSEPQSTDAQSLQRGEQVASAHMQSLITQNPGTTGGGSASIHATGSDTFGFAESGDSGSSFFITYKGELTLAGAWYYSQSGASPLWDGNSSHVDPSIRINAAMASTGYALRYVIYDAPADAANTANVWTGGAGSSDFAAMGNWSQSVIPANLPVVFDSSATNAQSTVTVNSNQSVRGIAFRSETGASSGFTFNGSGTLSIDRTGIDNEDSYTQTFNTNIALLGAQNWAANQGGLTVNGNIANNGYLLSIIGSKDTTLAGVLSGTGGLAKDESGKLIVSGINTYTGTTFIHDGTVQLQGSGRLGIGVLDFLAPNVGAILDLNGTTGSVFKDLRSEFGGTGRILFKGGTLTLQTSYAGNTQYAGSLEGNGSLVVTSLGGTQVFSGDNSLFTGTIDFQSGVLRFMNSSSWFSNSNLKMNGSGAIELGYADFTAQLGTGAGQVDLSGGGGFSAYGGNRNVNIGGAGQTQVWGVGSFVGNNKALVLSGGQSNATTVFQNGIDLNGASRAITVNNGTSKTDAVISGVISNSTGTGGLTKQGAGTLALTASNTYNGATTVAAGALLISNTVGSATGTGTVTVNNNAILGGTGRIGGSVVLNSGATLNVGDFTQTGAAGIGTLNIDGGLIWNSTSRLIFDLGASGASDLLNLGTSAWTKGTGTTFSLTLADAGMSLGTYTLVDFGSTTFSLSDLSYDSTLTGLTGYFTLDANDLKFTVTNVPEPSVAEFVLLSLVGVGFISKRRGSDS
ncbi:MAG: autotransporter-associated beta strand repeat-containing protein [Verrucomicrobiota bacterium]